MDLRYAQCLEAIRLKPLDAESYNNLGSFFYKQGRFQEAILQFKKALRLEPTCWPAHYNLANSYARHNQMEQAAVHYQEAIRYNPDHAYAQLNAGLAYIALDEFEKARLPLEHAYQLDPSLIDAARHLAQVYITLAQTDEAMHCLKNLIQQDPNLAEAHHNLAILYLREGLRDLAAVHFDKAYTLDPNNQTAEHMILALKGDQNTHTAPLNYIAQLFDQYAPYYNQHLKHNLGYTLPTQLRNAISPYLSNAQRCGRILDLGCGTGLCGVVFRDLALELVGVDISEKMLQEAKRLDLYEQLIHTDLNDYLQATPESFEIIVAADVLVYRGDLTSLFHDIQHALVPGGFCCMSIETHQHPQPYSLNPTGRFSHAPTYLESLASTVHLKVLSAEKIVLRAHHQSAIEGMAYILQKDTKCQ